MASKRKVKPPRPAKWECICGKQHTGMEAWASCYASHPRAGSHLGVALVRVK